MVPPEGRGVVGVNVRVACTKDLPATRSDKAIEKCGSKGASGATQRPCTERPATIVGVRKGAVGTSWPFGWPPPPQHLRLRSCKVTQV